MISILMLIGLGMQPVASYLLGYSAAILGIQAALRLNGLLMITAIAALLFFDSELRKWETEITVEGKGHPAAAGH